MLLTRFPFVVVLGVFGLLMLVAPSAVTAKGNVTNSEVTGTITIDGKPLMGGKITFHRDNGQFVGSKVKDGKYKVDHMPAGILTVTFEGKGVTLKYASEATTGIVVQVVGDGPNRFDFELTTPNPN